MALLFYSWHHFSKGDPLELSHVLRHEGPPRTEYFLEIPTCYGNLRLDLHSPVEVALTQTNMTEEMQKVVEQGIAEAIALGKSGNEQAATNKVLALAEEFPYSADV